MSERSPRNTSFTFSPVLRTRFLISAVFTFTESDSPSLDPRRTFSVSALETPLLGYPLEEIFQTRIDTQVDGGAWYPETIQGWVDHAQVVRNGNYVMLIANENSDAIVEAFEALFA